LRVLVNDLRLNLGGIPSPLIDAQVNEVVYKTGGKVT